MKKSKTLSSLFLLVLCSLISFFSCESGSAGSESSGPRIIFVGTDVVYDAVEDDDIGYAGYWENGSRTNYSEENVEASCALYTGGSIYAAGIKYYNGSDERACYWVDGVLTLLESIPDPENDATLSFTATARDFDGSAYVAGGMGYGTSTGVACYWVDGVRTKLESAGNDGLFLSDVIVYDGDVYAFGCFYDEGDKSGYWKNGVRGDLLTEADTWGSGFALRPCTVDGSMLYMPCENGYFVFDMSNDTYSFTEVADAHYLSRVKNISGHIYAVGTNSTAGNGDMACLWIDGVEEFEETTKSEAYDVALVDDVVYVCGVYKNDDDDETACYWKDGVRVSLTDTLYTEATSILVIE